MALTQKQIRDSIYTSLRLWNQQDRPDASVVSKDFVNTQINLAQADVRLRLRDVIENWSSTLVTGQRSYDLPSDYLLYDEVWIKRDTTTNYLGERLLPTFYSKLVKPVSRFDTSPETNTPKRFAISTENVLYLDPVPDSGIRIDLFYLPYPSEMTADADLPDFKEVFHDLVRSRAEYKVARSSGRDARFAMAEFRELLTDLAPFAKSRKSKMIQIGMTGQVPYSEF